MTAQTHVLLVQARVDTRQALAAFRSEASRFCSAEDVQLQRVAWSSSESLAYVYCDLREPRVVEPGSMAAWSRAWTRTCPELQQLELSRLEKVFDVAGASSGAVPAFHYVVETDPEEGWESEMFEWYDTEHMPGLAAVPGCIRATRYLRHDHGPRSFACYDLVSEDTLGSPAWLAVRGTAWSSRVRPHFTHTRRTMFEAVAA